MIGEPKRIGFHTVTPYFMVVEVDPVVEFLCSAFDGREHYRTIGEMGGQHAEVEIGDSMVMVGGGNGIVDEPVVGAIFLYVEDVDAVYERALAAGASSMLVPEDGMFDEERGAGVVDPFGNSWFFGKHGPGSKHQ